MPTRSDRGLEAPLPGIEWLMRVPPGATPQPSRSRWGTVTPELYLHYGRYFTATSVMTVSMASDAWQPPSASCPARACLADGGAILHRPEELPETEVPGRTAMHHAVGKSTCRGFGRRSGIPVKGRVDSRAIQGGSRQGRVERSIAGRRGTATGSPPHRLDGIKCRLVAFRTGRSAATRDRRQDERDIDITTDVRSLERRRKQR